MGRVFRGSPTIRPLEPKRRAENENAMGLKLLVTDTDDLRVVASALQDAILRVGDIRYDPVGRSVTLQMSRFRHEDAKPTRILTGLRIDGVMTLQSTAFDRSNPDAFAVLLDVSFEETDAPSGYLTLTLAGGGALRMEVEGLDLILSDAGEEKRSRAVPNHDAPHPDR